MAFRLHIVTPQASVVDTEVDSMVAPGREGEFGVLEGHEPFLAPLVPGVITYVSGNAEEHVVLAGGFAEVDQGHVTVLAGAAERAGEIESAEAQRFLADAQAALEGVGSDHTDEEIAELEAAAAHAAARLRVTG